MAIKIEKGIPMPVTGATAAMEIKPMEVGDSFFVPNCSASMRGAYVRAAELLPGFGILVSAKATETVDGVEVEGLRFWRAKEEARLRPRKYQPVAK